jgi:hypothetical protein
LKEAMMDTARVAHARLDTPRTDSGVLRPIDWTFEQNRRAQVADLVLSLWRAARGNELGEYLQPIPVTRLHAAQRAFLEVGAMGVVHVLRWGLFNLRRVGAPKPLPQVVAEMTTLMAATSDDVERLVVRYIELGPRSPLSPPGVGVRNQQTHSLSQSQ